jgi:phosphonate transport system substrate-binding protein
MLRRCGILILTLSTVVSCTFKKAELGTEKNPVKLYFVPSVDAKLIDDKSKVIKAILEKTTPYKFEIGMPASFVAVVEAFGTKRADVASVNTFGYILAHEKYGAEALLTVMRFGLPDYQGQIIARTDSAIKTLADLNGKKFAFVDPASTSGYLLPLKLMHDAGIKPSETVFAQKHDNVVSMVYQKQVDAGATFYSPVENNEIQDARRLVKKQYPDVEEKIKIIQLTESIPNDPIVFRKDLPPEMKTKIADAIMNMMETPEGKDAFFNIYGATAFKRATDADYEKVRAMLAALGKNAAELMKK